MERMALSKTKVSIQLLPKQMEKELPSGASSRAAQAGFLWIGVKKYKKVVKGIKSVNLIYSVVVESAADISIWR